MPYLAHPDSVDLGYEFMTLYYAGRCATVAQCCQHGSAHPIREGERRGDEHAWTNISEG